MVRAMNKADMTEDAWKIWKVLKTERENHDTTSLYLEGDDENFKKRQAGQWLLLRILRNNEWSEAHPFTISCSPEDDTLRLTIKKAGTFTSAIPELRPGTPVKCDGPFGVFCKDIDQNQHIVMIAGGVGITPFLSVLRHFRIMRAKNQAKLFWTNKTIDDVFAAEELQEMTKELDLLVVHTLSREKEVNRYLQGDFPQVDYASGYVTRDLLQRRVDLSNASFYLCGPPKMQEFVLGELEACGVSLDLVEKERFSY
jgi:predicted ferric reductase